MAAPTTSSSEFDFDALHDAVAGIRRKQLFFIGGAPKSGTTWLQLLLNAHPGISCSGEGHFPNKLMPGLAKALKAHNTAINEKSQSIFDGVTDQPLFTTRHALYLSAAAISLMLSRASQASPARIVGEKTPDNVRYFPLLATLFPRAKFIHIVRDARDCTVSAWFHNQRLSKGRFTNQFPAFSDFTGAFAKAWVTNVSLGAKFATQYPTRCFQIRYEDLSHNSIKSLNELCGFLGASQDAAVLESCLGAADFVSLSGGRARGQEDRGSFFRQGLPGDWRGHFDAQTELAFREKVEPWLSMFHYL